jgi:hypothetical protein
MMWKTLAPIVAGLGLLLAVPAPAAETMEPGTNAADLVPRVVALKGMLRREKGEKESLPPIPFEYWTLNAGGKTYYLHLRGKDLLERAEKLVNRPVEVAGVLDPASPTLRVTSLKADEFVKQTINVEVRGRLEGHREPRIIDPWPDPWERPRPRPMPPVSWWIYLGEKSYQVDFDVCKDLLDIAKKLDGKSVIVTGTRVGEVIHATAMKADEGTYQETVTVELQGVLGRVFAEEDVWLLCYPPIYGGKIRLPVGWEVTADGKTYTLAFGNNTGLERFAAKLVNRPVVVTGTLKDGVVTVTDLQHADPNDWWLLAEPCLK